MQYINKHDDIFKNYKLMEIFREIIKYKLQMTSTYDDDLMNELQRKVYIIHPDELALLRKIIKNIFFTVHERFRICLWGCFNTNIQYKTWLKTTIKEKIIIRGKIYVIDIPKYCGTPSIDSILRKWLLIPFIYKLQHFPFNSKLIIKGYAHSLHQFSFVFFSVPQTLNFYNYRIYVLYKFYVIIRVQYSN